MKIGVPSGIGDISWLVSKLVNTKEWPEIELIIADGWPFRADDYLRMIGKVKEDRKDNYGLFCFDDIVAFEANAYKDMPKPLNWKSIADSGFGMHFLQPNHFLEMGRPLAEYLPDLPTNYHYPLTIPAITNKPFYGALYDWSNWVGVSCASYRGAHAWKTWELDSWLEFSNKLLNDGFKICLMGGRWDDLTDALGEEIGSDSCLNLVGKTTFGEACAVHKMCKFYVGFSSGLGIIRTVMDLPTMLLWPEHQQPLSFSWVDPEDLDSRKYVPSPYVEVKGVYSIFKSHRRSWEG